MEIVVGVRFKDTGKIYDFSPDGKELVVNDGVIVETARGVEYGTVVYGPREQRDKVVDVALKPVMRKATAEDTKTIEKNRRMEKEAFAIAKAKIEKHKLKMNLLNVDYTFDVNKIIFYFTSDGRVDFRELVKDLAAIFRTRIELRQVGVRDEAKSMGGVGCCGREICCKTFLGDFVPVSIRMAKEQNISLNPTKISGICGRLMCCLKYESQIGDTGTRLHPPKMNAVVVTERGEGMVIGVNRREQSARIQLKTGNQITLCWDDVTEKDQPETVAAVVVDTVEEVQL
ncbi:MAG: stage 0 sporulation family protein [Bacillota bacterium]